MKLLNKQGVCEQLKISARCLETWVSERRFPAPVRIGRCAYWDEAALERWKTMMFSAQNQWRPGS